MTTKKKPAPKFEAEILLRTWVQVPLEARTFEDALAEAQDLKDHHAVTYNDGCCNNDSNVTLMTVRQQDVLKKLDD